MKFWSFIVITAKSWKSGWVSFTPNLYWKQSRKRNLRIFLPPSSLSRLSWYLWRTHNSSKLSLYLSTSRDFCAMKNQDIGRWVEWNMYVGLNTAVKLPKNWPGCLPLSAALKDCLLMQLVCFMTFETIYAMDIKGLRFWIGLVLKVRNVPATKPIVSGTSKKCK